MSFRFGGRYLALMQVLYSKKVKPEPGDGPQQVVLDTEVKEDAIQTVRAGCYENFA